MSWQDRLERAAYISPDGQTRIAFDYEVLRRTVPRKTSVYDFPDASATFVQDLGVAGRRFPFRVIFWGPDYDQTAQQFEQVLAQRGPGTLQHPQLGAVPVIAFGDVTRRDDLTREANQAIYEVTFYETLTTLYPEQVDTDAPRSALADALAADFDESSELDTAGDRAKERPRVLIALDDIRAQIGPIAANVGEVAREFDRIISGIETGIDELLQEPADLAFNIQRLVAAPATASRRIEQTVRAYRNLILGGLSTPPIAINDLQLRGLIASASASALSSAVEGATYATRAAAVNAAAELAELTNQIGEWRDQRPAGVPDLGRSYGLLLDVTATTAGNVIRQAFNLAQARRIVTDRPRMIVDLAFEFYKDPEQVDRVINENGLTGSEILTVPGGRELVYFV